VHVQNELRRSIQAKSIPSSSTSTAQERLTGRPAMVRLYQENSARLLGGEALDLESLIDILTLGHDVEDPATALDRLRRDVVSARVRSLA
jgi:hypothetical protein